MVRAELEARHPCAVALFVTGCAGDADNGHPPEASITTEPSPSRTFAEAGRVGRLLADATADAARRPFPGPVRAVSGDVRLDLDVPSATDRRADADRRQAAIPHADPATAALLDHRVLWARGGAGTSSDWTGPVTVLRWGGVRLVALPGSRSPRRPHPSVPHPVPPR